jgi:hypothetical protein
MPRLADPDLFALSETAKLRRRREDLLSVANRRRYRLQNLPRLTGELQRVTTDLLRLELEAKQAPEPRHEPLGDAGAVGDVGQARLPYKD